jgi:hypothetical protein
LGILLKLFQSKEVDFRGYEGIPFSPSILPFSSTLQADVQNWAFGENFCVEGIWAAIAFCG